jgi:A1 cistron-splicing factor AAR2
VDRAISGRRNDGLGSCCSAVSREGQTAPRTGFFHNFSGGELVAKRYNQLDEDVEDVPEEDRRRIQDDLKNLDGNLGAYPYDSWKKWISLTNRISPATISR